MVRAGDDRALETLLLRRRGLAQAKARSYFLIGADHDDLVQEGMIGLYKAVREFDERHETSFRTFAELCVARQIVTAVKATTRHKHGPLNNYVSFHRPMLGDGDDEYTLGDVLPSSTHADPAEQVLLAEWVRHLRQHFCAELSPLEVQVVRLYADGKSYQEIASILHRHTKSIDNALQRIKRKLDVHFVEWNGETD